MKMYVVDTTALVSYYSDVFELDCKISEDAISIIESGIINEEVKLIIPNVVFVEIFAKFFFKEEMKARIIAEVFKPLKEKHNIAFMPLEREVLENFIQIVDIEAAYNFDNHDKQVLATAMMFNCPLITSDRRLYRYNRRKSIVPIVIS